VYGVGRCSENVIAVDLLAWPLMQRNVDLQAGRSE
jgi:hypothetical protein